MGEPCCSGIEAKRALTTAVRLTELKFLCVRYVLVGCQEQDNVTLLVLYRHDVEKAVERSFWNQRCTKFYKRHMFVQWANYCVCFLTEKAMFSRKKMSIYYYQDTQNGLKRREIWFWTGVRMYVCVYVLDFQIFKPLQFISGLRYRVKILYSSEAVTSLQSSGFSCKLMTNLRFYGISNCLKNVYGNFRKIWAVILKLNTIIIYRSRTFSIEFGQYRLERSNFLRFWIFWIFLPNYLTSANFELSRSDFVREYTYTK